MQYSCTCNVGIVEWSVLVMKRIERIVMHECQHLRTENTSRVCMLDSNDINKCMPPK